MRLTIDNRLVINRWNDHPAQSFTADVDLTAGHHLVVVEYYENGGVAAARLGWACVDDDPPPTPVPVPPDGTVFIDNAAMGFAKNGAVRAWHTEDGGYEGKVVWTRNNDRWRTNYNWARWYADLEAKRYYKLCAYAPEQNATTAEARYWISHYDGFTLQVVDQSAHNGRWVSLGTYRFRGTRQDYVSLADITYVPYLSRQIAFDAVKWVPQ